MLTSQQSDSAAHTVAATVHGRFLLRGGPPERVLVGFHGYAENAERHLAELLKIDGIDRWTILAVQALHRFYAGRTGDVVGSWMTSQDRDLAIADNLAYVRSVVAWLREPPRKIVFAGFSQGVAMAYRAASDHAHADGLIVLGGDVPPEVTGHLPPVLLGRGTQDTWYNAEKFEKDLKFLRGVTTVTTCVFEGGHEWSDEFRAAAAAFLQAIE